MALRDHAARPARNATSAKAKNKKKAGPPPISRVRKPDNMTLEEWQIALRRQFGREQKFRLANLGEHLVFSEFAVTNPESKNTYTVRIRGPRAGDNACTCPDFTTNALGTCKHIEFTLARLEGKRATRAMLKAGYLPPNSEIYLQYGSRREVQFRPGSECPVELARLAASVFDELGTLRTGYVEKFDSFLVRAKELEPDLECRDDVLSFVAELHDAEYRRERVASTFPQGLNSDAFADLLKVNLYDYQREGALFAARAGRCLIGDEMGLGKTIQAIAAAEIMGRLFGVERVLVVCPTSLKHQWQREVERFTTRPVGVINGLKPQRDLCFRQEGHFFKITNYDTVHADLDRINAWSPDLVILDEAQRIKNWATRVARSVKKIESAYAIVLTGTPLENRLEELVSIVQFVDLFRLGPTFRLLHDHQVHDDNGKVVGYKDLDKLGQSLGPVLLRRQKEQVLDQLPGRIDTNLFVPMTQKQMDLHKEAADIVARIVNKWRIYKFLSEADKQRLMMALQRMRMACDSSYLLDTTDEHGKKADEAVTLLDEMLERPGTKVVVFSQWLRMHELLTRRLVTRSWGHVLFHGGLTSLKRKDLVDRFREDPNCRVFLSTDAGGVGLNLQFASVVFNMDVPWNPAVLEQRIGRVHRLGQQQPVRVVNFVARGAIEEGMLSVLQFKRSLFSGVLDGGDKDVSLGGTKLTKFMESVEAATAAIPTAEPEPEPEPEPSPAAKAPPTPVPEPPAPEPEPPAPAPVEEKQPEPPPPMEEKQPEPPAPVEEKQPEPPPPPPAPPPPVPPAPPWAGLLQAGMSLLQQLTAPPPPQGSAPTQTASPIAAFMRRDERTGEPYFHLPVPPQPVLDQAVSALTNLLTSLITPPQPPSEPRP